MVTWLADVLRAAGLDVYEDPGWQTRETRGGFDPVGVVCHHTATGPNWLDGHVAALLRQGRRDLPGPLSQAGLERDGTWVLIAAGRANHNGFGLWGNDSIGIEAYNDGVGEPWPPAQMDAYVRGVRAICAHQGWGADRVKGHRETDPGRKIDPTGIDMAAFRQAVFTPDPPPAQEDDDMPIILFAKGKPDRLADGPCFSVLDALSVWNLVAQGVKRAEISREAYQARIAHTEEALGRNVVDSIEAVEAAVLALDG